MMELAIFFGSRKNVENRLRAVWMHTHYFEEDSRGSDFCASDGFPVIADLEFEKRPNGIIPTCRDNLRLQDPQEIQIHFAICKGVIYLGHGSYAKTMSSCKLE